MLALLLVAPAFAAAPVPTAVQDGAVVWSPDAAFSQALVTLTAPSGLEYRHAFTAGESVRVHPSEIGDEPLADGFYGYELVLMPTDLDEAETATALLQRGTLEIRHGAAVSSPLLDQVFNDDLIVRGSGCFGQDCVNGENFGFDTVRLKENNLRIHFDDTSNSGSFPSNDWRITINDSANGGQSYFSIDDATGNRSPLRIRAGAPNWSIYVAANGSVGFGTDTPVVELHSSNGDTPTLRLEQSGASGFTPYTWDVAANETNFFIRDVNGGSKLPFRVRPNAGTSSIDMYADRLELGVATTTPEVHIGKGGRVRVDTQVLVGFTDPSNAAANTIFEVGTDFDVDGDGIDDDLSRFRTDVRVDRSLSVIGDLTGEAFAFRVTNQAVGGAGQLLNLDLSGNLTTAGTVNGSSDINVKEDIVAVDPEAVLAGVAGLPISTWEYIAADGIAHMGPMAQDFYRTFGLGQGETTISMVDADGVSLAAIQALHTRSEAATARIAELEAENAALAARLARIEALLGTAHE